MGETPHLKSSCYFYRWKKIHCSLKKHEVLLRQWVKIDSLMRKSMTAFGWVIVGTEEQLFLTHYRFRLEESDDVWPGFLLIPISDRALRNVYASESLRSLSLHRQKKLEHKTPTAKMWSLFVPSIAPRIARFLPELPIHRSLLLSSLHLKWSRISCIKKSETNMHFKSKRCVSTDKIVHHLTAEWTYTMDFPWSRFIQVFLVNTKRVSLL